MAVGDRLKAKICVEIIRYYDENSNFGILVASILEVEAGEPAYNTGENIVIRGVMPQPKRYADYMFEGEECEDPKWGKQYICKSIYHSLLLNEDDVDGQRKYLETLFTETRVALLYRGLKDPYQALLNKDVQSLVTVSGVGFKTAHYMINKFERDLAKSRIYVELADYELTPNMVNKLYDHFQSADLVIQNVTNNPYTLMALPDIGWKRCDAIAMKKGMGIYAPERVEAYVKYYLSMMANQGYTYIYSNEQLMPALLEIFGNDIPDEAIAAGIKRLGKKLWWSEDKEAVGIASYIRLEQDIAKKLIELRDAPNTFKYDGWEEVIAQREETQGWKFTEQQIFGIKTSLENQVTIITGLGGTGKSSIVAGVVEVLKNYEYAQCALSGRAAARLAEVTDCEGFTIHRLLDYPKGDSDHQGFAYNQDRLLPYDIIIVDEISMVDGDLFYKLIRAIKPGAKLIMLGDVGQLESIGCSNIANDLIESSEIVSVVLDKIHRQAEASAIITESIKARNGVQVVDKEYVGTTVKGELQDLTYTCYSDANNTFYKILQLVSNLLTQGTSIQDLQVIVPIKERGNACTWNLNLAIQELYNPLKPNQDEIFIHYSKNKDGIIRVGDKVINVVNNYKAVTYVGQWDIADVEETEEMGENCPIFNGNMGTVIAINKKREELIVDFIGIGKILIDKSHLNSIVLGYAVTVHKCQGSEFPYVIFGCDYSSYSLLTRQMIYTAITRAKKHCYVLAQTGALRYAIAQNKLVTKQTILKSALYDIAHPKLVF